jgi:hypothetical protein
MIPSQSEIHPLLKACTFAPAHLNVGDDIIAHTTCLDAELAFYIAPLLLLAETKPSC